MQLTKIRLTVPEGKESQEHWAVIKVIGTKEDIEEITQTVNNHFAVKSIDRCTLVDDLAEQMSDKMRALRVSLEETGDFIRDMIRTL